MSSDLRLIPKTMEKPMTTKATFKCENCGFEKKFSICSICHGVIDFPHNPHPDCPKCAKKMHLRSDTIHKITQNMHACTTDERITEAYKIIEKYRFLKAAHKLLRNSFYINAFYYKVAYSTLRLSEIMYKYLELRGIDAFNYFIANLFISFSQRFRKIQTGVLSYNMLMMFIGATLLIVLLFLFGEHIL